MYLLMLNAQVTRYNKLNNNGKHIIDIQKYDVVNFLDVSLFTIRHEIHEVVVPLHLLININLCI